MSENIFTRTKIFPGAYMSDNFLKLGTHDIMASVWIVQVLERC